MMSAEKLLNEAHQQLEDLMCGREVKLGIVAHMLFMPHLFRALPDTTINPVIAAASAALKDVAQTRLRKLAAELGTVQMEREPEGPRRFSLRCQAGRATQGPRKEPVSWVK